MFQTNLLNLSKQIRLLIYAQLFIQRIYYSHLMLVYLDL